MLEDILNMSAREAKDYILNLPYEKQKQLFSEKSNCFSFLDIYELFFKKENYCYFRTLIFNLNGKSILLFCNENMLPFLKNDDYCLEKVSTLLECDNEYIKIFLSNPEIIKILGDNIYCFINNFPYYNLDKEYANVLFDYVYENYIDNIGVFFKLNEETVTFLISKNYNRLLKFPKKECLIKEMDGNILSKLLTIPTYYYTFINMPYFTIKSKISSGVKIPFFPSEENELIDIMVNIIDVNEYREMIHLLEKNNMGIAKTVEGKRKKKYLNDFFDLTDEKQMFEITLDMFFDDFPYNVLKSINELLSFLKDAEQDIIPKERYEIYYCISNYTSLTIQEKHDLFNIMNQYENLSQYFYTDMLEARNLSYSLIKQSLLRGENLNKLYSPKLSQKYKQDIYELSGEEFYLLVTATKRSRDAKHYSEFTTSASTSSFSLISEENINTFLSPSENIILGFSDFNIDNIMHVFEADSYSHKVQGSKVMSKLYTPSSLMQKTLRYNEILYKNEKYNFEKRIYEKKSLPTSYVICFDDVKPGDLSVAKMHNIPIILIRTKFYKKKDGDYRMLNDDDFDYLNRSSYLDDDYYKKKTR